MAEPVRGASDAVDGPLAALPARVAWSLAGGLLAAAAVVLLLVESPWSPVPRWDTAAVVRLHRLAVGHPLLVTVLAAVSTVFAPLVFRLAATVLAAVFAVRRRRRLAGWMLVASWGSGLVSTAVKAAVGRTRPVLPDPVGTASGGSFPSGHAIGALVGCGVLLAVPLPLLRRPAGRVLAAAVAVAVLLATGFSRVGLGVHYPSDVLAGYLLGGAWLAVTAAGFRRQPWSTRRNRRRLSRWPTRNGWPTSSRAEGRGSRAGGPGSCCPPPSSWSSATPSPTATPRRRPHRTGRGSASPRCHPRPEPVGTCC